MTSYFPDFKSTSCGSCTFSRLGMMLVVGPTESDIGTKEDPNQGPGMEAILYVWNHDGTSLQAVMGTRSKGLSKVAVKVG
jgi:hypothetical protein